jgi:hypothetical protein
MKNAEIQRGLQRAGFVSLRFVPLQFQNQPAQNAFSLFWNAPTGGTFQVEYSPDLSTWFESPTGEVQTNNGGTLQWSDTGPPATISPPAATLQRLFRVFQFGPP